MEVEFRNITITVANVSSAKEAYQVVTDLLANALPNIEWTSDKYVVHPDTYTPDELEERDTEELFA
jgi:hypothetical protein